MTDVEPAGGLSLRSRRFSDLTWPEVDAFARAGGGVIVPVGSTEQHAYHLPLDTDVVLASELALAVAEEAGMVVAPPVAYGYRSRPLSGGGQGFPGTVSVSARTLMAVVEDVVRELVRNGFRRIVLLNWHFENANFIYEAAWLATGGGTVPGVTVMVVEAAFAELSEPAMRELFGDEFPGWDREHAAVLETSLMLLLRPDSVLLDRAVDDGSAEHPFYDMIPPPPAFLTESGGLWKATRASRHKGQVAWGEITAALSAAVGKALPRPLETGAAAAGTGGTNSQTGGETG